MGGGDGGEGGGGLSVSCSERFIFMNKVVLKLDNRGSLQPIANDWQ